MSRTFVKVSSSAEDQIQYRLVEFVHTASLLHSKINLLFQSSSEGEKKCRTLFFFNDLWRYNNFKDIVYIEKLLEKWSLGYFFQQTMSEMQFTGTAEGKNENGRNKIKFLIFRYLPIWSTFHTLSDVKEFMGYSKRVRKSSPVPLTICQNMSLLLGPEWARAIVARLSCCYS